jgi:hypothetical protein
VVAVATRLGLLSPVQAPVDETSSTEPSSTTAQRPPSGSRNLAANYKTDADLRKHLTAFFASIEGDVEPPSSGSQSIFAASNWRLIAGIAFVEGQEAQAARLAAIKRVTTLLGPVASHETDVDDILWSIAAERAATGHMGAVADAVKAFLTELEASANRTLVYVDHNYAISFEPGIDDIQIGPVRAVRTPILEAELQQAHPGRAWGIATGEPSFTLALDGSHITFNMVSQLWSVTLSASKNSIREQAAWLIDIALSLLRLGHQEAGAFFPLLGEEENHPLGPDAVQNMVIILDGPNMATQSGVTQAHYRVDPGLKAITQGTAFQARTVVFDPPAKSVAERVAQGLGWMTRGRRSKDRAERLLYFFTAIEALLSNDDKNAPVVQTIARHASVVLAQAPADRVVIAKNVKDLYGLRSGLVHTGKRSVSKAQADAVQALAEALYIRVMDNVDLTFKQATLYERLGEASYGGPWP